MLLSSPTYGTPLLLFPQRRRALALREIELERRGHLEALNLLVGQATPDAAGGDGEQVATILTFTVFSA